jgi:O-antigen ligase
MNVRNEMRRLATNYLPASPLSFWVGVAGVIVGLVAGILVGAQPIYLFAGVVALAIIISFFADFERTAIALLILRSSLDIFSAQQIPALFAVGLAGLTLLYVAALFLERRTIHTDWFWWFLLAWVMLQGLWPILCALGGLGLDASPYLADNVREWTRLFSWAMVYLLVMQMKDRVAPQKIIALLFFSLIPPIIVGMLQKYANSLLPSLLALKKAEVTSHFVPPDVVSGTRINSTFAHPNNFVLYLLLFICLACWQLLRGTKPRWLWVVLLFLMANLYLGTGAIFGLVMLVTALGIAIAPRLKLHNTLAGVLLLLLVVAVFASTDYGRSRLDGIAKTPLLNPDIDVSRAIIMSVSDYNSFNWRIAQWYYLLQAWLHEPWFGYGLGTGVYLSPYDLVPHNDYVRALVEGGIVGLVTFVAILVAQAIRLLQLLRQAPKNSARWTLCWSLLALLIATSLGMATDNVWSGTAFYFYWWTVMSIAGWDWRERSDRGDRLMPSMATVKN